jgi:hypothetical protein
MHYFTGRVFRKQIFSCHRQVIGSAFIQRHVFDEGNHAGKWQRSCAVHDEIFIEKILTIIF